MSFWAARQDASLLPGPSGSRQNLHDAGVPQLATVGTGHSHAQAQALPLPQQPGLTSAAFPRHRKSGRRWRLPGPACLCKLLAVMVGLLVVVHVASCGFFFCIHFPALLDFRSDLYEDLQDISVLAGGPRRIERSSWGFDDSPKLIPKIIHQTYKSTHVPDRVKPHMQTWRHQNEDWEIRFYDDAACLAFVQREFPEYVEAYKALPKDVERSDFFRYMVILRLGGIYADVDTECRQPMSKIIQPRDTLVVGWENEFSTAEEAHRRSYVRKRQILQWVFAAAPGHPALREMCEHVATHAMVSFGMADHDTLERTGPGPWTDIVLKHARLHPPSNRNSPFNVRLLPQVAFGAHPLAFDGIPPDHPSVIVMHHFLGSWKIRRPRDLLRFSVLKRFVLTVWRLFYPLPELILEPRDGLMEDALPFDRREKVQYPVSVSWQPSFTIMVDLAGHGELQAGDDVGHKLSRYGTWQPGLQHRRAPTVADALVGSLGGQGAEQRVLLDVGAGLGFHSLAAAARGHQAIAFELSPTSHNPFNASIAFNGYSKHITLHQVALGAADEAICIPSSHMQADEDVVHGYSHPDMHSAALQGSECRQQAIRKTGASLVPAQAEVGAVRISAPGWEGWVLQGLQEVLTRQAPPGVVLMELHSQKLESNGFPGGALTVLQTLYSLGYTEISHSGRVCDERYNNITRSIQQRRAMGLSTPTAIPQPTWCTLFPEKFDLVASRVRSPYPENILFTYRGALSPSEEELAAELQNLGSRDQRYDQSGKAVASQLLGAEKGGFQQGSRPRPIPLSDSYAATKVRKGAGKAARYAQQQVSGQDGSVSQTSQSMRGAGMLMQEPRREQGLYSRARRRD